ncbi:MAG: FMN-binding protein [Actinobacteria bacterium]|nr:FMN-binding protein [Actinomycetota bacterium]MTH90956.1 FMN-binding protein [Actinomycetota bacterium]
MVVNMSNRNSRRTRNSKPSLARQVIPAIVLTSAGVGFVSLLDGPQNSGEALDTLGAANTQSDSVNQTTIVNAPVDSSAPVAGAATQVQTTLTPVPTVVATTPTVAGAVVTVAPVTALPATALPTTAPPTTAPAPVDNSCTGDAVNSPSVNFRWGVMQLQATFTKSNVLCDVTVLQYPNDRRTSVEINQYSLPIYNQEAIATHSAKIRAVSGATYSWQAYSTALQAVLDSRP